MPDIDVRGPSRVEWKNAFPGVRGRPGAVSSGSGGCIVEKGNAKSGGCQLWATSVATNHETYDDRKVVVRERR